MKCPECQNEMIRAKSGWLCMGCGHSETEQASTVELVPGRNRVETTMNLTDSKGAVGAVTVKPDPVAKQDDSKPAQSDDQVPVIVGQDDVANSAAPKDGAVVEEAAANPSAPVVEEAKVEAPEGTPVIDDKQAQPKPDNEVVSAVKVPVDEDKVAPEQSPAETETQTETAKVPDDILSPEELASLENDKEETAARAEVPEMAVVEVSEPGNPNEILAAIGGSVAPIEKPASEEANSDPTDWVKADVAEVEENAASDPERVVVPEPEVSKPAPAEVVVDEPKENVDHTDAPELVSEADTVEKVETEGTETEPTNTTTSDLPSESTLETAISEATSDEKTVTDSIPDGELKELTAIDSPFGPLPGSVAAKPSVDGIVDAKSSVVLPVNASQLHRAILDTPATSVPSGVADQATVSDEEPKVEPKLAEVAPVEAAVLPELAPVTEAPVEPAPENSSEPIASGKASEVVASAPESESVPASTEPTYAPVAASVLAPSTVEVAPEVTAPTSAPAVDVPADPQNAPVAATAVSPAENLVPQKTPLIATTQPKSSRLSDNHWLTFVIAIITAALVLTFVYVFFKFEIKPHVTDVTPSHASQAVLGAETQADPASTQTDAAQPSATPALSAADRDAIRRTDLASLAGAYAKTASNGYLPVAPAAITLSLDDPTTGQPYVVASTSSATTGHIEYRAGARCDGTTVTPGRASTRQVALFETLETTDTPFCVDVR